MPWIVIRLMKLRKMIDEYYQKIDINAGTGLTADGIGGIIEDGRMRGTGVIE